MAIGIRGTVNKLVLTNVPTVTLNCTGGIDWTTPPQPGDIMLVSVMLQDDSGAPAFTAPAGWTNVGFAQGIAVDAPDALRRLVSRRFVSSPEATYTWTSTTFGGATTTSWIIQGVCLTGVPTVNPIETGPFPLNNQGDRNPQAAPNVSVQANDSALISSWGTNPQFTQPYVSVAAINGVAATFIRDSSGFACFGCWLAPGKGIWTPTATRGVNPQGHWGSIDAAIKAAPPPTPPPPPPLGYPPSSYVDEPKRHRHRYPRGK